VGSGDAQSLLLWCARACPLRLGRPCLSNSYATYHVGGFLISIGDIGCVVDRFRWCRRWTGIVREALMRSGGVKGARILRARQEIRSLADPRPDSKADLKAARASPLRPTFAIDQGLTASEHRCPWS
jgi:hypothetical protein